MGKSHRFSFADDYEGRAAPANVWLPRAISVSLIAGLASVLHLFGFI